MLNRRTGGGVLWGLTAAVAESKGQWWRAVAQQASWHWGGGCHAGRCPYVLRGATSLNSHETQAANTIVRNPSNGDPLDRGEIRDRRVLGLAVDVHEATPGGPRGSAPGRNDSMRTI